MNDDGRNEMLKVALAELLHDAGKFAQRAGMEADRVYHFGYPRRRR